MLHWPKKSTAPLIVLITTKRTVGENTTQNRERDQSALIVLRAKSTAGRRPLYPSLGALGPTCRAT